MKKYQVHCFYCGEYLYESTYRPDPRDYETCGERECEREARYAQQAERDEAYARAADDDFEAYR